MQVRLHSSCWNNDKFIQIDDRDWYVLFLKYRSFAKATGNVWTSRSSNQDGHCAVSG